MGRGLQRGDRKGEREEKQLNERKGGGWFFFLKIRRGRAFKDLGIPLPSVSCLFHSLLRYPLCIFPLLFLRFGLQGIKQTHIFRILIIMFPPQNGKRLRYPLPPHNAKEEDMPREENWPSATSPLLATFSLSHIMILVRARGRGTKLVADWRERGILF